MDLTPHFAAFGEAATLQGAAVRVIFDTEAIDPLGNVITSDPSVLVSACDAPSAAAGQAVVRGGVTYAVRQVLQEPPDGALLRLVLARV